MPNPTSQIRKQVLNLVWHPVYHNLIIYRKYTEAEFLWIIWCSSSTFPRKQMIPNAENYKVEANKKNAANEKNIA